MRFSFGLFRRMYKMYKIILQVCTFPYIIYSHLLFSLFKIDIVLLEYYISNTSPPSVVRLSLLFSTSVINENSPPILENDILMEDGDVFADPSTSKFEKSKTDCSDENHYAGMELPEQIKEKFQKSASNSEKVLLLTPAPKSWGRRRLAEEFNASERQTGKAERLIAENGILTSPNLKKGKN